MFSILGLLSALKTIHVSVYISFHKKQTLDSSPKRCITYWIHSTIILSHFDLAEFRASDERIQFIVTFYGIVDQLITVNPANLQIGSDQLELNQYYRN